MRTTRPMRTTNGKRSDVNNDGYHNDGKGAINENNEDDAANDNDENTNNDTNADDNVAINRNYGNM